MSRALYLVQTRNIDQPWTSQDCCVDFAAAVQAALPLIQQAAGQGFARGPLCRGFEIRILHRDLVLFHWKPEPLQPLRTIAGAPSGKGAA